MGARSRLHKPLLLTGLHSGPGLENGLWKTKGQWHKLLNPEGLPGHSCLLGSLHTSRWAQDRVPDRSTNGSDAPPPQRARAHLPFLLFRVGDTTEVPGDPPRSTHRRSTKSSKKACLVAATSCGSKSHKGQPQVQAAWLPGRLPTQGCRGVRNTHRSDPPSAFLK